ncbi:hypothetical protein, partial [Lactobacillus delbrueckii]
TPNLTAFTGVDSQNLPDVMVSVQFILAIGDIILTGTKKAAGSKSNTLLKLVKIICLPSSGKRT